MEYLELLDFIQNEKRYETDIQYRDAIDTIRMLLIQTSLPLTLSKKYNVRVFHSNGLDEVHEFDTLQAANEYAEKQQDFCLISMAIKEVITDNYEN